MDMDYVKHLEESYEELQSKFAQDSRWIPQWKLVISDLTPEGWWILTNGFITYAHIDVMPKDSIIKNKYSVSIVNCNSDVAEFCGYYDTLEKAKQETINFIAKHLL